MNTIRKLLAWFKGETAPEFTARMLTDMRRVVLAPGDVMVLTTDKVLNMEQRIALRAAVGAELPGVKTLVLESVQVGVIAQKEVVSTFSVNAADVSHLVSRTVPSAP
jgi:hypothetical protein